MILDIKLFHDDGRGCVEDFLASTAIWYGRDYQLMFAHIWDFDFRPCHNDEICTLGNRVSPGRTESSEIWKSLETYHGIKVIRCGTDNDYLRVLQIIKEELSLRRPVIIGMDMFWCSWYEHTYQKIRGRHGTLVIGYDEKINSLLCIDGGMAPNTHASLSFDDFKNGCTSYITFSFHNEQNIGIDWREIIKNISSRVLSNRASANMFDLIRNFANEVLSANMQEEVKGNEKNPFLVPLFSQVSAISRTRRQFGTVLKYIYEKYSISILSKISEKMERIGLRWTAVQGILIKAYYYKEDTARMLERAAMRLRDIADEEEQIAYELLGLSNQEYIITPDANVSISEVNYLNGDRQCIFVDLTKYLNNHGIANSLKDAELSNFNATGGYIKGDSLPEQNIWCVDEMRFSFPNFANGTNDNISCTGQVIDIPNGKFSSIMVLGCSEWGNHAEKMVVEYKDGIKEELPLEFSDWSVRKPIFGDKVAFVAQAGERLRKKEEGALYPLDTVSIYAQRYKLNHNVIIERIYLPDCPNLHIFAISLT